MREKFLKLLILLVLISTITGTVSVFADTTTKEIVTDNNESDENYPYN